MKWGHIFECRNKRTHPPTHFSLVFNFFKVKSAITLDVGEEPSWYVGGKSHQLLTAKRPVCTNCMQVSTMSPSGVKLLLFCSLKLMINITVTHQRPLWPTVLLSPCAYAVCTEVCYDVLITFVNNCSSLKNDPKAVSDVLLLWRPAVGAAVAQVVDSPEHQIASKGTRSLCGHLCECLPVLMSRWHPAR